MVHLLTYVPELRGKSIQIIEEPIVLRNVELFLMSDGKKVNEVYLAPSGKKLDFEIQGKYLKVTVPEVNGYQMVVFNEENLKK